MSVDRVTERVIDRPTADVAAFAAEPDKAPTWYASIKSVAWESEPPR